jgi:hypothetical protein
MKLRDLRYLLVFVFLSFGFISNALNLAGDTLIIGSQRLKLLSGNLNSNTGFENGFTVCTDVTTSASTLTSEKFNFSETGRGNIPKYLVGLVNENSSSSSSIASDNNPMDMTSFIVNPTFNDNTAAGWQGAGTVNNHEVEFYQKTFNMYQTISGLPAGKYRLRIKAFERPKSNDAGAAFKAGTETIYARLYANTKGFTEVSVPFNSLYKHSYTGAGSVNGYVNTMTSAEIMFTNNTAGYYDLPLSDILIDEGQTLTIGAKTNFQQTGYWALFDNFSLEYFGQYSTNDLALAIGNRIIEAQDLLTKRIQKSAVDVLTSAINQAQNAISAIPLVSGDVVASKKAIDDAINAAYTSKNTYDALQKAIDDATRILGFLDKADEITRLKNAIDAASLSLENRDLTLLQIVVATNTLKTVTKNVGKKIYNPTWMMGDINSSANNWSLDRSRQSKNWIIFWEPGFGNDPGKIVDDCLNLAEKCFDFYTDSLKFIKRGSSKTDTYKMIIRLRYTDEWEATGSGVDNTIGLLTLTSWALTSRGGQTVAHEVGHCFQYQTHCDNNNNNGWMYGFGDNGSGGNGWWEQCAQWQAYKVFPSQQFTGEWFSGYLSTVNKNMLHESPRYNNYFIQDYWSYVQGIDIIGRLWNKSYKPEDPVETYKRLTGITQVKFNDEMWDCAARFATWDIPAIKSYGAAYITTRPQPKLNNTGNYVWKIDQSVCPENYGHNIIRINAPQTAKTITVNFEGLAGADGFRKNYVNYAGWRYGFVALLKNGTRIYSDKVAVNMSENGGVSSMNFECPVNCDKLWFVVSGAPGSHFRHAWDDNDANDEQWPYQVKFYNTNLYGYANVPSSVESPDTEKLNILVQGRTLCIKNIMSQTQIRIYNTSGIQILDETVSNSEFTYDLPSGIYIVTTKNKVGITKCKISVW